MSRAPAGREFRRVSRFRTYATAILVVGVCSLVKLIPGIALGQEAPFALLGIGVLFAGWLSGVGSALVTSVLLTVVAAPLFFPSLGWKGAGPPDSAVQLVAFLFEGLAVTGIVANMNRSQRLLRLTAQRLEALQTLTAALAVARTVDEVASILVARTSEFLGAVHGMLVLPSHGGTTLRVAAVHGEPDEPRTEGQQVSLDAALPAARAFRTGHAEWIEDGPTYLLRYPPPPPAVVSVVAVDTGTAATPRQALISLPLIAAGQTIGAAVYRFAASRRFSENERSMVLGYVTQAAQALDRTLVAAREAVAHERLQALADISMALSAASTRQAVASVVVERGMAAVGADTCTLYVLVTGEAEASAAAPEQFLDLIGDRGVAPEVLEKIRRITVNSNNETFTSLSTGKAIWTETHEQYQAALPQLSSIKTKAPRAKAYWSVPLMVEGRAVGLLGMGFYEPHPFSADERSFVETFTGHCAQALLRAQRLDAERAARLAAERAEALLATTLMSIGDAVITTDTAGRVTFMNPVAEQMTGWPTHEARGQPLPEVFRILNEHTRQAVESPVDKVLQTGLVVGLGNHTVLLNRAAEREIPIDDSGAPIRSEAGDVQGVVLVFRDVTEKKELEKRRAFVADASAALASSLDYRATLAHLAELFVPKFADWSAVDVLVSESERPRRLAVMHVDPQKIALAHSLAEKYPEPLDSPTGIPNVLRTGRSEIYPDITPQMLRAGARDDEHLRLILGLQLKSAMVVPLVARGHTLGALTLVHAESNRRYTADDLAFVEDIARRAAVVIDNAHLFVSEREARVAADIANRAKDDFLATVSHELRTPLNAILGWARLMAKAPEDEVRRTRGIEVIERNAIAMARLIEDLLDISRVIGGKVRLELAQVDVMEVIQAAVDAVRPSIESKALKVQTRVVADAEVTVWADAHRLQQVLWNLLTNALKFTAQGGRIDITVRRDNGRVVIQVADDGKGIDPAFMPHVFEPFRQADGSITRVHGGLGLGLAISRHLVKLHGGEIRVESDGPGRGATFTVTLPANRGRTGDVPPVASAPPHQESSSAAGLGLANNTAGTPANLEDFANPSRTVPPEILRGLKVLAVDDDPDARQLLRMVLEDCGSSVRLATNVGEAMQAMRDEIPDVLVSDIGMPGEDGYALIRKVRLLPGDGGGNVPAAALTAYTGAENRVKVLNAGYSVHLAKPIEPAELIAAVAELARQSRRRTSA